MIKLALVGKNISHSLSPKIYKDLLNIEFSYDLIDVEAVEDLPPIEDLKKKYKGINITSPYKMSYSDKLNSKIKRVKAINCISFFSDTPIATNTDYEALEKLIPVHTQSCPDYPIALLGNGVMAKIISELLTQMNLNFTHLTRKDHGDLSDFNLQSFFASPCLVINACSRDFVYTGKLQENSVFWDMNYKIQAHAEYLSKNSIKYIDGESLLIEQAKKAVEFWGL